MNTATLNQWATWAAAHLQIIEMSSNIRKNKCGAKKNLKIQKLKKNETTILN